MIAWHQNCRERRLTPLQRITTFVRSPNYEQNTEAERHSWSELYKRCTASFTLLISSLTDSRTLYLHMHCRVSPLLFLPRWPRSYLYVCTLSKIGRDKFWTLRATASVLAQSPNPPWHFDKRTSVEAWLILRVKMFVSCVCLSSSSVVNRWRVEGDCWCLCWVVLLGVFVDSITNYVSGWNALSCVFLFVHPFFYCSLLKCFVRRRITTVSTSQMNPQHQVNRST